MTDQPDLDLACTECGAQPGERCAPHCSGSQGPEDERDDKPTS